MSSGWFTRGPVLDQRAGSALVGPTHLVDRALDEEYVALLGNNPEQLDWLLRKDDLLDEGVAAVFRSVGADVELVGLCFRVRNFTPLRAARWLAERGFTRLRFITK